MVSGALLGGALSLILFHYPAPVVADVEVAPGLVGERDQALMRDVVAAFDHGGCSGPPALSRRETALIDEGLRG